MTDPSETTIKLETKRPMPVEAKGDNTTESKAESKAEPFDKEPVAATNGTTDILYASPMKARRAAMRTLDKFWASLQQVDGWREEDETDAFVQEAAEAGFTPGEAKELLAAFKTEDAAVVAQVADKLTEM